MARGKTAKLYRTFVQGLITEAGFLTYPENASTDELNTMLKKKGSRSRRLGIEFEPESVASDLDADDTDIVSEYLWKAVDDRDNVNFLVVQVGSTIHFYDSDETPITGSKKSFTIDLTTYKSPTATNDQVASAHVEMTAGKGWLFIVQEFIEPLLVEYDEAGDTISVMRVLIRMRDYDGVNDGLANDQEPLTLTNPHHYNLRNQGWITPGTIQPVGA